MKYFIKGKKSKAEIKKNHVFVAEIIPNIFIYGMIINPSIRNAKKTFFNGNCLIVFYNIITEGIDIDFYEVSPKKPLQLPNVVLKKCFDLGSFRIVDTEKAVKAPKLSYGFYDTKWDFAQKKSIRCTQYYNEEFHKMRFIRPKLTGDFGIYTEYGLYISICKSLVKQYEDIYKKINDERIDKAYFEKLISEIKERNK